MANTGLYPQQTGGNQMDPQSAIMMQNYAAMSMNMQNPFAMQQMVNRMMINNQGNQLMNNTAGGVGGAFNNQMNSQNNQNFPYGANAASGPSNQPGHDGISGLQKRGGSNNMNAHGKSSGGPG